MTAAEQVAELPEASVAVKTMLVTPTVSTVPGGGFCVIITELQSSVAVTLLVRFGSARWQLVSAVKLCGGAHARMTGGWMSRTVNTAGPPVALPAALVTSTE